MSWRGPSASSPQMHLLSAELIGTVRHNRSQVAKAKNSDVRPKGYDTASHASGPTSDSRAQLKLPERVEPVDCLLCWVALRFGIATGPTKLLISQIISVIKSMLTDQ